MKLFCIAIFTALLCLNPAQAVQVPGLDGLWDAAEEYGVTEDTGLEQGLSALLSRMPGVLEDVLTAGIQTAVKLLAVVLVCSLGEGMRPQAPAGELSAIRLAGALAITALTMTDVASMIGLGRETIGRIHIFSGVLLPVMAFLAAAGGNLTAAAAQQGATVLFSQGLVSAMNALLVPMVYAYAAVSCARTASGNPGLEKLAQGLKSAVTGFLTALLVIFVGYLTASGAVAGSVDLTRAKAARMAISRAIPVVGGILSDAAETVVAGAGVLRGSVGAAGMLVVLAICLTPFLHLAGQYLIYKGTAVLCATVARGELAVLIDAIGSAFGLILGMTGAAALILLVSVVSAILTVNP